MCVLFLFDSILFLFHGYHLLLLLMLPSSHQCSVSPKFGLCCYYYLLDFWILFSLKCLLINLAICSFLKSNAQKDFHVHRQGLLSYLKMVISFKESKTSYNSNSFSLGLVYFTRKEFLSFLPKNISFRER